MTTPCFWVERSGDAEVQLRRYSRLVGCTAPDRSYHNAAVPLGRSPLVTSEGGNGTYAADLNGSVPADDPRWPTACGCGYSFVEGDYWQVNQEPIYRALDGREWRSRSLPPGAMLDAAWMPDNWKGPDGMALTVVLPEGPYEEGVTDTRSWWWNVDGPSTDGDHLTAHAWTRTGDPLAIPPTVSATPSINAVGRFHGWLANGMLSDPV